LKSYTIDLDEDEIEAVLRKVDSTPSDILLTSYEDAVVFGILHQLIEQEKDSPDV